MGSFTGECVTSPGRDPKWRVIDVEQDNVFDISCKDASKCNEPPQPSALLTHDFDNFKIEVGHTFSYFCPTKEKSEWFSV